jgi:addiction module HigA family antidote
VIKSFADKDTRALYLGRCPQRWRAIRSRAERKVTLLDAAASLDFLRAPPGNRLEKLGGDRGGQWSIRINDRWRVCIRWEDGDARDVEIVDYHWGGKTMAGNKMRPIHPGEILREEYMSPLGLSANSLARALGVTPARINDIVRERRGITADTALRLARYFGTDARSWMNLQSAYDLRVTELAQAERIAATVRPRAAWGEFGLEVMLKITADS